MTITKKKVFTNKSEHRRSMQTNYDPFLKRYCLSLRNAKLF